ncbi:MAG TPA: hypothetical protein VLE70_11250, partial [Anaerolineae bacterium]|nr:hypothetical protein [Anaerolineae bacterium]
GVPIFESTTDTSRIRIDTLHVFFDTAQGGLLVMEVYSLSNVGDRTVKEAYALDDGLLATLRFPLPEEAASVRFEGNSNGRYVTMTGGFADTTPLQPGNGTGQVIVSYVLPYESALSYSKTVDFPTAGVNFLLSTDIGLSLEGDNLLEGGQQRTADGGEIAIFSHDALEPGETVQVSLSGTLLTSAGGTAGEMRAEPAANDFPVPGIAIGGILLGLALIIVGIWWYRRPLEEEFEEEFLPTFDEVVRQIAYLDEAYDRQDIDEEEYSAQRAALREQVRSILVQAEH